MPACDVGPCQRTSTTSTLIKGQGSDSSWRCPCAQRALESVRMVEGTHPQPPSGPLRITLGPHIKFYEEEFSLGPHLRSARLLKGFSSFIPGILLSYNSADSRIRNPRSKDALSQTLEASAVSRR